MFTDKTLSKNSLRYHHQNLKLINRSFMPITTVNGIKAGDKVHYKDEPIQNEFTVYAVYSDTEVSLGLRDYPDVEQDFTTNISEITKI